MEFKIELLRGNVLAHEIELLSGLHGEKTQMDFFVVQIPEADRERPLLPDFVHKVQILPVIIEFFNRSVFPDVFQIDQAGRIDRFYPPVLVNLDEIGFPEMSAPFCQTHVGPFRKQNDEKHRERSQENANHNQEMEKKKINRKTFLIQVIKRYAVKDDE